MDTLLSVRVDATGATGAGHAMRCATLAEAWRRAHGEVEFVGTITTPFVRQRLDALAIPVYAATTRRRAAVYLVDSYDPAIRDSVSDCEAGLTVIVDDVGDPVPAAADVIWNPNAYSSDSLYPSFAGPVIGGSEHVPVRDDLPHWTGIGCRGSGVTLGGSSAAAATIPLVAAGLDDALRPVFATGADHPNWQEVNPDAIWTQFAGCCRLICGAGITTWEAAVVGIPVVLVVVAENQTLIARWAREAGAPVVDVRSARATDGFAGTFRDAVARAIRLPRVTPGADRVATALKDLWTRKAAMHG